jgi:hypothetical protein
VSAACARVSSGCPQWRRRSSFEFGATALAGLVVKASLRETAAMRMKMPAHLMTVARRVFWNRRPLLSVLQQSNSSEGTLPPPQTGAFSVAGTPCCFDAVSVVEPPAHVGSSYRHVLAPARQRGLFFVGSALSEDLSQTAFQHVVPIDRTGYPSSFLPTGRSTPSPPARRSIVSHGQKRIALSGIGHSLAGNSGNNTGSA